MQTLDVALRQCRASRLDDDIQTAEMIRRLHHVVHRRILAERPDCLGLEYPPRLLMRESATLHMVGIVGEVDLQPMVDTVLGL